MDGKWMGNGRKKHGEKIFSCANKWLIFAQKNAKNKKKVIICKIICTGQKKAVSLPRKLKNAREKRINRRQLGNGVSARVGCHGGKTGRCVVCMQKKCRVFSVIY